MRSILICTAVTCLLVLSASAGEDLKLNQHLDCTSDSHDGPLIKGHHMDAGFKPGKPAYVILYQEGCFNSKHQAKRTVNLYEKYKGQVQFVIIDLDQPLSSAQQELEQKYFKGYIPHVVVLDRTGTALYNASGEVDEAVISQLLDKALR